MSRPALITPETLREFPLPEPRRGGDKNTRGRALVIAGSLAVPGAALLAAVGVLRAGAGKVRIATCAANATLLGLLVPEAYVIAMPESPSGGMAAQGFDALRPSAEGADAILIGPGMMDEEATSALAARLLSEVHGPGFVIDAGAMKRLRQDPELVRRHAGRIVLTPHAGEMAGLLDIAREEVEADPLAAARSLAAELRIVVVMKGAGTDIVSPQGQAWHCGAGNSGLATSGSGDTLAGFITGLLARGADPVAAAAWGVFLHGEAGDRLKGRLGPLGYLARELLDEAPAILADHGG